LTEDDSNKKEIVYHYSREHRLRNASPELRALNDGDTSRPSLGKVMFGSRGNKFLILGIVVICIFGFIINHINRETPAGSILTLGGNSLALAVLNVEELLILWIVKNAPERGEFYIGEVDIAISPVFPRAREGEVREEPPVFAHRVMFNPVVHETFYISLPFDGEDFIIILRAGDAQRSMRLRVAD